MISYLTKAGCLVYHYNPVLDDQDEREKAAIIKHWLVGKRISTIGVTKGTDFLRKEAA